MMSVRQGPVRFLKVVPTPLTGRPFKLLFVCLIIVIIAIRVHTDLPMFLNVLDFENCFYSSILEYSEDIISMLHFTQVLAISTANDFHNIL